MLSHLMMQIYSVFNDSFHSRLKLISDSTIIVSQLMWYSTLVQVAALSLKFCLNLFICISVSPPCSIFYLLNCLNVEMNSTLNPLF
jgi:hypothetical protein